MDWNSLAYSAAYATLGLLSFLAWYLIYDYVLTPGLSVREALFNGQGNTAVALDITGGLLALGILTHAIISDPALDSFWVDIEATALSLVGTIVLLGVLRLGCMGLLRLWFGERRDGQGEIVTFNNELFGQRNLATGLFSTGLYFILVAGLVEEDLLNLEGYRLDFTWNMAGTWLLGLLTVLLHSWVYLGFGTKNHILHESFHDNNPAAPLSMLGLLGGMLLLNHQLLDALPFGWNAFNQVQTWLDLLVALLLVLLVRLGLHWILRAGTGINMREELVIRDNPAWGILDAALIFGLFLILLALV